MLVGIDVLDVVRMEKFIQNERFLDKYFTPYEIEYVNKYTKFKDGSKHRNWGDVILHRKR